MYRHRPKEKFWPRFGRRRRSLPGLPSAAKKGGCDLEPALAPAEPRDHAGHAGEIGTGK
jgi:hypothetical protein